MMAESGVIVTIRPDPRRAKRLRVQVDPGRTLSVHQAVAKALKLAEGQEAQWEDLREQASRAEEQAALETAARLLRYSDRTRWELEQRLRDRGFARSARDAALSRAEDYGYVDDLRFARRFVERRCARRPCGRRALAWELKRKGVAGETVETVLDELLTAEAELAMAINLLQRRLSRTQEGDDRARQRLYSLLSRRGFDPDTIRAAMTQVLPDLDQE
ncbi:MAG: regulatory protein RecX [Armatimonadota bacterium]